jgi:hypothetical protein
MIPALDNLAVELLENIASHLEYAEDFRSLRLVSKYIKSAISLNFGRKFLTALKTDLSAYSLDGLEQLAEAPDLRKHVRSMAIFMSHYQNLYPFCSQDWKISRGDGSAWVRHDAGYLLFPALPVDRLRNVLKHGFVNCRSFHVWPPGLGTPSHRESPEWIDNSDALAIILTIIAEAELPVESFSVSFRLGFGETMDISRLPPALYREPDLRVLWSCLRELSLELEIVETNHEWLQWLVQGATQLRKLSLCGRIGYAGEDRTGTHFFDDLVASWTNMPPLEEIHLKGAFVSSTGLKDFSSRVGSTLHTLSFELTCINSRGGDWKRIFMQMDKDLTHLENVSLMALSDQARVRIHFPTLLQDVQAQKDDGVCWITARPGLELYCNKRGQVCKVHGVKFQRSKSDMSLGSIAEATVLRT